MNTYTGKMRTLTAALAVTMLGMSPAFAVVNSGSTGADGAFNPTVNTPLNVPPGGVFNFISVNIPVGVTVTFNKNTTNTPVVILATGNVTVAGTININGSGSTNVGAAGDGNIGDDGLPGSGGVGGYGGGRGGATGNGLGGSGLGPGGGGGGNFDANVGPTGGGGGGFSVAGARSNALATYNVPGATGVGGSAYGSSLLLPLTGGSGGGGGSGGSAFQGAGGGGGGGAILIASSGTVSVTGSILANGGQSGACAGPGVGAAGGGGSGGAIRIVATGISGNGVLSANVVRDINGNLTGITCTSVPTSFYTTSGGGAAGYIRLEAETFLRTAVSTPPHSFAAPGPIFIAGLPTLRITSVAGVNAPADPTGNADITLPVSTANPVTVTFATTGVPVGNTVKLTVTPANATPVIVTSPALTGTAGAATASVSVSLPGGPSTLQAVTTYTIVASLGDALGNQYAKGERVEKIEVAANMNGGPSSVTLITVSGKRVPMAGPLPALAG